MDNYLIVHEGNRGIGNTIITLKGGLTKAALKSILQAVQKVNNDPKLAITNIIKLEDDDAWEAEQ